MVSEVQVCFYVTKNSKMIENRIELIHFLLIHKVLYKEKKKTPDFKMFTLYIRLVTAS